MPEQPLHPNCHFSTIDFPIKTVKSICPIEKFTEYIFTDKRNSKGKIAIFKNLGYNINDSEYLKSEFESQSSKKYLIGDYTLDVLDNFGQRINIVINLPNGSVLTGWQVRPNGIITNNTPYAGNL